MEIGISKYLDKHKLQEHLGDLLNSNSICVSDNIEDEREKFISQFVDLYLAKHPLDSQGLTHVEMVRLEVDAYKKDKTW